MLSEQRTAEYYVKTEGLGLTVEKWKSRPDQSDSVQIADFAYTDHNVFWNKGTVQLSEPSISILLDATEEEIQ